MQDFPGKGHTLGAGGLLCVCVFLYYQTYEGQMQGEEDVENPLKRDTHFHTQLIDR